MSFSPVRRFKAMPAKARAFWITFCVNVLIGIGIEWALHWAEHPPALRPVAAAQNIALDAMMRSQAAGSEHDTAGGLVSPLALVAIDDITWRHPAWGGGEPATAPRAPLLSLIKAALDGGASQVVLDVLIESAETDSVAKALDDIFAKGLGDLVASLPAGSRQQLVLVRSLRAPIAVGGQGNAGNHLPELRDSAVDAVAKAHPGRIVIASPYFRYSADNILRDWDLFALVCRRTLDAQGRPTGAGTIDVVPSVQLAVASFSRGQSAPRLPDTARKPCTPFPVGGAAPTLSSAASLAAAEELDILQSDTSKAYWQALRSLPMAPPLRIPEHPAQAETAESRLVYRFAAAPLMLPAHRFLPAISGQDVTPPMPVAGHVVVIGQTYAEVPDVHATPLGLIAGPVVLLNAIDSLQRQGVLQAPSTLFKLGLAAVLVLIFSAIYAYWTSFSGTWIATGVVLVLLAPLSYGLFKFGVWLDFALPLLGIQIHSSIKAAEEFVHARSHATPAGRSDHH